MTKKLTAAQFRKLLEHYGVVPGAPVSEQQLYEFANAVFHLGSNADVMKATFKEKK